MGSVMKSVMMGSVLSVASRSTGVIAVLTWLSDPVEEGLLGRCC